MAGSLRISCAKRKRIVAAFVAFFLLLAACPIACLGSGYSQAREIYTNKKSSYSYCLIIGHPFRCGDFELIYIPHDEPRLPIADALPCFDDDRWGETVKRMNWFFWSLGTQAYAYQVRRDEPGAWARADTRNF